MPRNLQDAIQRVSSMERPCFRRINMLSVGQRRADRVVKRFWNFLHRPATTCVDEIPGYLAEDDIACMPGIRKRRIVQVVGKANQINHRNVSTEERSEKHAENSNGATVIAVALSRS